MLNKSIIYFAPFAFGGNPASESGPRCLQKLIRNDKTFENVEFTLLEQEITESPLQFLERIQFVLEKDMNKYDRIVFIGGNHLSVLPMYRLLYSSSWCQGILTLDAHRDYYPDNKLNHATFFKELKKRDYLQHLLFGVRDYELHNENHEAIKVLSSDYQELLKHDNKISFVDIDVDVLEPEEFSWCGSVINNGLSLIQIKEMICDLSASGCSVMAISEYIPNWDSGLYGANQIVQLIKIFL